MEPFLAAILTWVGGYLIGCWLTERWANSIFAVLGERIATLELENELLARSAREACRAAYLTGQASGGLVLVKECGMVDN